MINNNTRFLGVDSTKVNLTEKKDALNNAVTQYYTAEEVSGRTYKVYTALLNQSGTDAPVATILENTIGNIFWSYVSLGIYELNLSSDVDLNKVLVLSPIQFYNGPSTDVILSFAQNSSTSTKLRFRCNISTGNLNNSLLLNHGLEIRVYN